MAELSDFPNFDPESVALMGGHRVGVLPPNAGTLIAGELYIEVTVDGVARLWVGTARPGGVAGNLVLVATSEGIEQPEVPPAPATEAPVCVDTPYLSGAGVVGETLSCTMGNWTGEPTAYGYFWREDVVSELGTDPTYTVTEADVGHRIDCIVTATNAVGETLSPPSNAVIATAAARAAPEPEKPRRSHHK